MPNFTQNDRAAAQKSIDGGAAEHWSAAPTHAPAADTLAASPNQSPRSQALMQLRTALDASPRTQALQGLERALNRHRPGPASAAEPEASRGSHPPSGAD